MCHDGPSCSRAICFFAHTPSELRSPTYVKPAKGAAKQAANLQLPKAKSLANKPPGSSRSVLSLASLQGRSMGVSPPAAGKSAATAALAGASMDRFAASILPPMIPLGSSDFAQLMQQEAALQQNLHLEDLHLQMQQQLQLEDLQARLACLNTNQVVTGTNGFCPMADPSLPSSNFLSGDVSSMLSGLSWQVAPCSAGPLGGSKAAPLPGGTSDMVAAAAAASVPGHLLSPFPERLMPGVSRTYSSSSSDGSLRSTGANLATSPSSLAAFLDSYAVSLANSPSGGLPSLPTAAGAAPALAAGAGFGGLQGNPLAAAMSGMAAPVLHQGLLGDPHGLATQALVCKMMSLL